LHLLEESRWWGAPLTVSLALACFVFSGCAADRGPVPLGGEGPSTPQSEPRLPSAEADIRGAITEVERMSQETNGGRSTGKRIGVVLIEEDPDAESGSQKDSVTVMEATKLFERRERNLTPIAFDGLEVGHGTRAWYTGPVAESYPRQATAKVIVVYPPDQ